MEKKWRKFVKQIFATTILLSMLLLVSCGSDTGGGKPANDSPPDLTGEWKQVNGDSEDSYQSATISDGVIEVYWVSDGGDTKSLYWAGTYEAPTNASEPYSWASENDHEKTDSALLASGDDQKTFTYENGQISYDVSAMGMTTTVRLEKQ